MQPVSTYKPSRLGKHSKIHSGEKFNKCNQCDYASSEAENLRRHLKSTSGKSQSNATNVSIPALMGVIWAAVWEHTVGKSQKSVDTVY